MTEKVHEVQPHQAQFVWDAEGVSAGFSDIEGVITDINLKIRPGERIAIIGHEKSGRSFLIRTLAGLRPIRTGRMSVLGHELGVLPYWADWNEIYPPLIRRRMGVCLEIEGLLSNVTAREGLELLFRFKNGDHSAKLREGAQKVVNQLAARFGITEALDKRPHSLTSAERRLVGLTRAFLSKPSVLLLENPSENIGNLSRPRLLAALEEITTQPERTVVISTDDWPLAHTYCNRWLVMDGGRIVFDGAPADYMAREDLPLAIQMKKFMSRHLAAEKLFEEAG